MEKGDWRYETLGSHILQTFQVKMPFEDLVLIGEICFNTLYISINSCFPTFLLIFAEECIEEHVSTIQAGAALHPDKQVTEQVREVKRNSMKYNKVCLEEDYDNPYQSFKESNDYK